MAFNRFFYMITLSLSSLFLLALSTSQSASAAPSQETAIFAGGCFWCMQEALDKVPGVIRTTVGYTGGNTADPSYKQVTAGGTGHVEAIQAVFDPKIVNYASLLQAFWHNVDPTDGYGQFCDRGTSYQAIIFYENKQQEDIAEKSKLELEQSGKFKQIAARILPAKTFYPAEEYHQLYYSKNPLRYKFYTNSCGRPARLKQLWENV